MRVSEIDLGRILSRRGGVLAFFLPPTTRSAPPTTARMEDLTTNQNESSGLLDMAHQGWKTLDNETELWNIPYAPGVRRAHARGGGSRGRARSRGPRCI